MQLCMDVPQRVELLLYCMNCFSNHAAEQQTDGDFGRFGKDLSQPTSVVLGAWPGYTRKGVGIEIANPKLSKHGLVRQW